MTEFIIRVLDNGITITNGTFGDTYENKVYENNHFEQALTDIYRRINKDWRMGDTIHIVRPFSGTSGPGYKEQPVERDDDPDYDKLVAQKNART